ncbi:MAG: saccharopine dehydrogenase NADP-binding domain-containing protein [Bacteroidetes bacterium]|nr:saccharopine dehydrogenase NADP-binding domain-containing protein [Bacteroidota bacterium]
MKICVLGTGLVGSAISMDLAKENKFEVTAVDYNENQFAKLANHAEIAKKVADLSTSEGVKNFVKDFDFVINALPSDMGFNTTKAVIEAGRNVIDISFFEEDPFQLSELAKEMNVTAIVDCGIAPGMSNILTGYLVNILDKTSKIRIYVGGIPEKKVLPWEYKAGFAPEDVINEYVRPARFVENGEIVTRPALTEPELIEFGEAGMLEAFNTDGLRSLIYTIKVPDMKEQTLRYKGHIEKIQLLKDSGFFSEEEIMINGSKIRPIDFTSKILFPHWEMKNGVKDLTVFKVEATGVKNDKSVRYTYDMIDKYDEVSNIHSMARTTGYTAAVVTRMVSEGVFSTKGLIVPEEIGKDTKCVEYILNAMRERGIDFQLKIAI